MIDQHAEPDVEWYYDVDPDVAECTVGDFDVHVERNWYAKCTWWTVELRRTYRQPFMNVEVRSGTAPDRATAQWTAYRTADRLRVMGMTEEWLYRQSWCEDGDGGDPEWWKDKRHAG